MENTKWVTLDISKLVGLGFNKKNLNGCNNRLSANMWDQNTIFVKTGLRWHNPDTRVGCMYIPKRLCRGPTDFY